jgi:uncharacterized protein YndB with AHSA1/START domain
MENIMSKRTIQHGTFVIERTFDATPAQVFGAFADQEAKGRWFVSPDDWEKSDHTLDFRVGGREHISGGPVGGPVHSFDCTYQDIVTVERIVYTYEMHKDDARMSVSLATLEFLPDGDGTQLILTEDGAFLDGIDGVESREEGTRGLLDNLDAALQKATFS